MPDPTQNGPADDSASPIRRIDLNLLNVFYAVMVEGSVTRAANRLATSQPAVSNALRRLRHLFQDELFIRHSSGVDPTKKALEVWPVIEEALHSIWNVARPAEFVPAETRLGFNIAVTDTLMSRMVPALATKIIEAAPLAVPRFFPHSDPGSTAALERGSLDCAVGMFPNPSPDLCVQGLLLDEYVCVSRRDNVALREPLSLDAFVDARHVLVKQATSQVGIIDARLSLFGRKRNIVMVVNSAAESLAVVEVTDLATVASPRSFVPQSRFPERLQLAALPFDNPGILYKLVWHERTSRDPARIWLRKMIKDVALQLDQDGRTA